MSYSTDPSAVTWEGDVHGEIDDTRVPDTDAFIFLNPPLVLLLVAHVTCETWGYKGHFPTTKRYFKRYQDNQLHPPENFHLSTSCLTPTLRIPTTPVIQEKKISSVQKSLVVHLRWKPESSQGLSRQRGCIPSYHHTKPIYKSIFPGYF